MYEPLIPALFKLTHYPHLARMGARSCYRAWPSSSAQGVYDVLERCFEVRGIACDKGHSMRLSCGSDEGIHCAYGPTSGLAARHHLSPAVGNNAIDRKDSPLEAGGQLGP